MPNKAGKNLASNLLKCKVVRKKIEYEQMSRVENVDCSPTKTSALLSFVLSGIGVEDVDLADPVLVDGQQLLVGTDLSSRKLAGALTGIGEKVRPFIDICHLHG